MFDVRLDVFELLGMLPDSLMPLASSADKFLSFHKEAGKDPLSCWLFETSKVSSAGMLRIKISEMVPVCRQTK